MKTPQLISPAGTLEKLKTAFTFGADAIYAGVPDFSLRARINNFTYAKIKQGTEFAHARNKKIYATLNIYPHNTHISKVKTAIKKYKNIGVDGFIISDPGILQIAKKVAPKINIHLSTQANCVNFEAAKFWEKQGVKRIVLARETSLKEIAEIHQKVPKIELECFVHGAMCVSYSGRCILSKLFTNRSANLGCCSQPCRREYKISPASSRPTIGAGHPAGCPAPFSSSEGVSPQRTPASTQKETFPQYKISLADEIGKDVIIDQDQHGTYVLNSKDLCLIEYLDKLAKAGVSSFKIEGRTKSAYYLAAITKLYRQTIDNNYIPPKGCKQELEKITNRGYTTGFLFSEEKCEHNFEQSHKECDWQFVGEVIKATLTRGARPVGYDELSNGVKGFDGQQTKLHIKIHNALYLGDNIEFITPTGKNIKIKLNNLKDAKTGEDLKEIHGGNNKTAIVSIDKKLDIAVGTMLRKKI
ncbi:MAG: U32 family peptidase C-terminal domain-containing protein [bacterium]